MRHTRPENSAIPASVHDREVDSNPAYHTADSAGSVIIIPTFAAATAATATTAVSRVCPLSPCSSSSSSSLSPPSKLLQTPHCLPPSWNSNKKKKHLVFKSAGAAAFASAPAAAVAALGDRSILVRAVIVLACSLEIALVSVAVLKKRNNKPSEDSQQHLVPPLDLHSHSIHTETSSVWCQQKRSLQKPDSLSSQPSMAENAPTFSLPPEGSNPVNDPPSDPVPDPPTGPVSDPPTGPVPDPPTDPVPDPPKDPTESPSEKPVTPTKAPVVPATDAPIPSPTNEPTKVQSTLSPTSKPTNRPVLEMTDPPSRKPTDSPTPEPTNRPVTEPTKVQSTLSPTSKPTNRPVPEMTDPPSRKPTDSPTPEPTNRPVTEPTKEPTNRPVAEPTKEPTETPVIASTSPPTLKPAIVPTEAPVIDPTELPTSELTESPVSLLTNRSTTLPTTTEPATALTSLPTTSPTFGPLTNPTSISAVEPTGVPTVLPTSDPNPFASKQPSPGTSLPTSPNASSPALATRLPTNQPVVASKPESPSTRPAISQPSAAPIRNDILSNKPSWSPTTSPAPTGEDENVEMRPVSLPTLALGYKYDIIRLDLVNAEMIVWLSSQAGNSRKGWRFMQAASESSSLNDITTYGNKTKMEFEDEEVCKQVWTKYMEDIIEYQVQNSDRRVEMADVDVYIGENNRLLDKEAIQFLFGVKIFIRAPGTDHNVNEYVALPFDTDQEKQQFVQYMRDSDCKEFEYATSLDLVLPSNSQSPDYSVSTPMSNRLVVGVVTASVAFVVCVALFIYVKCKSRRSHSHSGEEEKVLSMFDDHEGNDYMSEIGMRTSADISTLSDPIPHENAPVFREGSTTESYTLDYDFQKAYQAPLSVLSHDLTVGSTKDFLSPDDGSLEAQYVADEQIEVMAPAGILGLILETNEDGIPVVNNVKASSCLVGQVQIGDRLLSVDGEDVTIMLASDVSKLIAMKKHKSQRRLVFARSVKMQPQEEAY